jgi:multidrug efflux pump subunit AcrA (membrane-fusion protein)
MDFLPLGATDMDDLREWYAKKIAAAQAQLASQQLSANNAAQLNEAYSLLEEAQVQLASKNITRIQDAYSRLSSALAQLESKQAVSSGQPAVSSGQPAVSESVFPILIVAVIVVIVFMFFKK